jgi:hypothetical protein
MLKTTSSYTQVLSCRGRGYEVTLKSTCAVVAVPGGRETRGNLTG